MNAICLPDSLSFLEYVCLESLQSIRVCCLFDFLQ